MGRPTLQLLHGSQGIAIRRCGGHRRCRRLHHREIGSYNILLTIRGTELYPVLVALRHPMDTSNAGDTDHFNSNASQGPSAAAVSELATLALNAWNSEDPCSSEASQLPPNLVQNPGVPDALEIVFTISVVDEIGAGHVQPLTVSIDHCIKFKGSCPVTRFARHRLLF